MSNQTEVTPVEATDQDFQSVVVEGSRETPVLVDFWAPWCGPCKVIGPLLEKLAGEWQGKFKLVKVNMDENPMLAQALMIRSIPAVKLVMNGEIRDEFVGAVSEPEIRKFLEKNLPSAPQEDAGKGLLLWQQGHKEEALRVFEAVLAGEPENPVALLGLGTHMIEQGDLEGARKVADQVARAPLDKRMEDAAAGSALAALRARIFLTEHAAEDPAPAAGAPAPTGARAGAAARLGILFAAACRFGLQGDFQQALDGFLEIVKTDRKFRKDAGRLGMLAVFDLLPKDSPLVAEYRNRLSSLLFS